MTDLQIKGGIVYLTVRGTTCPAPVVNRISNTSFCISDPQDPTKVCVDPKPADYTLVLGHLEAGNYSLNFFDALEGQCIPGVGLAVTETQSGEATFEYKGVNAEGYLEFGINGVANVTYVLERATDLGTTWTEAGRRDGAGIITDTGATPEPGVFYRVKMLETGARVTTQ